MNICDFGNSHKKARYKNRAFLVENLRAIHGYHLRLVYLESHA